MILPEKFNHKIYTVKIEEVAKKTELIVYDSHLNGNYSPL